MNKGDITVRMGFVLLSQFAMSAFSSFADLLGMLDADTDTPGPCAWQVVADTLIPVRSASGVQVVPTDLLGDPPRFDYIAVVGGPLVAPDHYSPELMVWLRRAAAAGCHLLGLCNGVFALAQAGVLANHRVCVAGDHYRDFSRRFPAFDPSQVITDRPVAYDRRRITCAGGPAVTSLAVRILQRHLAVDDVARALRRLQLDPAELAHHQVQPVPPDLPVDCPPIVQRAVLLIEQYAGSALGVDVLADRLGVSARQLQRLFRQALDTTPQAYAREVRLRLAAWMLVHSDRSIAMIASDCGFADAAHMGRSFRAAYGEAPGTWRKRASAKQNTV